MTEPAAWRSAAPPSRRQSGAAPLRRLRSLLLLLAILGGLVATPRVGRADQVADRAAKLFDQGLRHYNIGEYDEAIARWKEGYKLTAEPLFIFNIAQANRLKGDCPQAVIFYRNYLREAPDAPNRAKVEEFIASMERCATKRPEPLPDRDTGGVTGAETGAGSDAGSDAGRGGSAGETTGSGSGASSVTAGFASAEGPRSASTSDEGHHPGRTLRITGLASAGVGLAAIATGVYFGSRASSKADSVEAACTPSCTWGDGDTYAFEDAGQTAETRAIILTTIGGAAVVTGAVLYVVGATRSRHASRVSASVLPRGAALGWSCDF